VASEPVDRLLATLKRLQEVLGEFNDLSVQQSWLLDALKEPNAAHSREVDAAIGGLITSLYERQKQMRPRIGKRISRFADPALASAIRDLGKASK
jgi:CHAD domain-containing protein